MRIIYCFVVSKLCGISNPRGTHLDWNHRRQRLSLPHLPNIPNHSGCERGSAHSNNPTWLVKELHVQPSPTPITL